MSDAPERSEPTPPPEPDAASDDAPTPASDEAPTPPDVPSPRSRGRRRRVTVAGLVVLIALLALARFGHPLYLPSVLAVALEPVGLRVTYDDLALSLASGDVTVRGVRFGYAGGGDPVATIDVLTARVDLSALLKGQVVVEEAHLGGLEGLLVLEEGGLELVRRIQEQLGPSDPEAPSEPLGTVLRVALLDVGGGRVRVVDRARAASFDVDVQELRFEPLVIGASESTFRASLSVRDQVEGISAVGSWNQLGAEEPFVLSATLEARGIRGEGLAPYTTPAGLTSTLAAGRVELAGEVRVETLAPDAVSVKVVVSGVRVAEGGTPLLVVERAELPLERLAPGDVQIGDVVARGVALDVVVRRDGALEAAGLRFERGSTVEVPSDAPPERSRVGLGSMRAELKRVRFVNEQFPGRPPIVLSDLQVGVGALALDSARPELSLAVPFSVRAAVAPIASRVTITGQAKPFARTLTLQLGLDVQGLRGAGVLALVPDLKRTLAADPLLDDGVVRAQANLSVERLDAGGLAARLEVVEARLLGTSVAGVRPVLASLAHVEVDVERIHPNGRIDASLLQLSRPTLLVTLRDDGLRVVGFRVLKASERGASPPASPDEPSGPERRIERFVVSGGELDCRDERVTPPTRVPLIDLDVEAQGLTVRAFEEPRPIRFRLSAAAGNVPLPDLEEAGGPARAGPALDAVRAEGSLVFYPRPTGTITTSVSQIELLNFRPRAEEVGVDLRGGALDVQTTVTLRGQSPARLQAEFTLHRLKISEPPGGPLGKALGLPAPLNVLIPVIRDAEETIRVPLDVDLGHDGVISQQTWAIVVPAVGKVLGRAFRDTPLKIAGLAKNAGKRVVDAIPLLGKQDESGDPLEALSFSFAPGDTYLSASEQDKLTALFADLKKGERIELVLQHDLGAGDAERLETRTAPSELELRAMLFGLTARRRELRTRRREARVRIVEALGAGDARATATFAARIEAMDTDLGGLAELEERLQRLLADRSTWDHARRVREASVALGSERLEAVYRVLVASGIPNLSGRIRRRPPVGRVGDANAGGTVRLIPNRLAKEQGR